MEIQKDIVVFYHGPCQDGFSSAWVAWKKFGGQATYNPIQPGAIFDIPESKEVYFIDVVPKEDVMKKVVASNKVVRVIDHHATNESVARSIPESMFDISQAASVLAWEYFNPGEPIPKLLQYIQDMDLWQWKLPDSEDICAYISLQKMEFENWDTLAKECEKEESRNQFAEKGKLLNVFETQKIDQILERNTQLVEFEGLKVLCINSSIFHSMVGNRLVQKLPPIGIIWQESKDKISVSLRSDGTVDVATLAEKFGGGGHPRASGFRLPLGAEKPWKIIKQNESNN